MSRLSREVRTIGGVGEFTEFRMPRIKARKFIPRRRVVALLASGLLLAACGGEEKQSGSFKMHRPSATGRVCSAF